MGKLRDLEPEERIFKGLGGKELENEEIKMDLERILILEIVGVSEGRPIGRRGLRELEPEERIFSNVT